MILNIPLDDLLKTNHNNSTNLGVIEGRIVNHGIHHLRSLVACQPFIPLNTDCRCLQIKYSYPVKIDITGLTKNLLDIIHTKDKCVDELHLIMCKSDECSITIENKSCASTTPIPEDEKIVYSLITKPIPINSVYGLSRQKTHIYRKPGTHYKIPVIETPPDDTFVLFEVPIKTRYDLDAPIYVAIQQLKLNPVTILIRRVTDLDKDTIRITVYDSNS